ncbi:MAG: hypothetical protein ACREEX_12410, partial [Caulobacteraceae bacterium]
MAPAAPGAAPAQTPAAPAQIPTAPTSGAQPAAPGQPSAAPAAPAQPPAPPPPPPPPTDPTAIALIDALDDICVPAVEGKSLDELAKAAHYRKSGQNWRYKTRDFELTIEAQGSNPSQCHVDIIHPVDQAEPAKPLIIALNNWAGVVRGYSLYRNDKHVQGDTEYITRSWENTADGKHEALVLTTIRKADDQPSKRDADTSEMIYSEIPAPH